MCDSSMIMMKSGSSPCSPLAMAFCLLAHVLACVKTAYVRTTSKNYSTSLGCISNLLAVSSATTFTCTVNYVYMGIPTYLGLLYYLKVPDGMYSLLCSATAAVLHGTCMAYLILYEINYCLRSGKHREFYEARCAHQETDACMKTGMHG